MSRAAVTAVVAGHTALGRLSGAGRSGRRAWSCGQRSSSTASAPGATRSAGAMPPGTETVSAVTAAVALEPADALTTPPMFASVEARRLMALQLLCVGARPQDPEWLLRCAGVPGRGVSEYDLCRGKITRVLSSDYLDFFDREPDFGIYDEAVSLEIGQPLQGWGCVHGKQKYSGAIRTLRRIVCRAVENGRMSCRVTDGQPFGHSLRVDWRCEGEMHVLHLHRDIHIHAISMYTLQPQAEQGGSLAYRIRRHRIEFVDIHPPGLRSLLSEAWWSPCGRVRPCFAFAGDAI